MGFYDPLGLANANLWGSGEQAMIGFLMEPYPEPQPYPYPYPYPYPLPYPTQAAPSRLRLVRSSEAGAEQLQERGGVGGGAG